MAFVRREELRPSLAAPAAVMRDVETLVRQTAGAKVCCRFEVSQGSWPILVDAARLETVLLNLAANARDAMPEGGTLLIQVRNAAPDEVPKGLPLGREFVRIAVADTGSGMDAETLRRAAEPFFTTKPKGKGTGLGLASAQAFTAGSGGALRLDSAPGRGTTVELFLPRAAVAPAAVPAVIGQAPTRHGDATILVVDDDDAVRPMTAGLLRDLGYHVVEAASAEAAEALAHLDGMRVDLLVTDVVMGGAPGPLLAGRLRGERPDLPVLYVTGHGRATALDAAQVLCKPFTHVALGRAVLAALGRLETAQPDGSEASGTNRLHARLRSPALREAHLHWIDARMAAAGALPSPGLLPPGGLPAHLLDCSYLAEVLPTPDRLDAGAAVFRFERFGRALAARLGRELTGLEVGAGDLDDGRVVDVVGASLATAYARCARSRSPGYDYARFRLDADAPALLFERLLLPLSADGIWVTHLLGVVSIQDGA